MVENAAAAAPKTVTFVIDRPVYNSPGCLPLMPGDSREFEPRLVAHLVQAGFMHPKGGDPLPTSVAANQVLITEPQGPATVGPQMPAAPAAIDEKGQPLAAPNVTRPVS